LVRNEKELKSSFARRNLSIAAVTIQEIEYTIVNIRAVDINESIEIQSPQPSIPAINLKGKTLKKGYAKVLLRSRLKKLMSFINRNPRSIRLVGNWRATTIAGGFNRLAFVCSFVNPTYQP
ncbi:MAG: hypothetical protein VW879_14310, partial [Opitutae bacterium]